MQQYNEEIQENGLRPISFVKYFTSSHFIEATFENWESEFLQMGMFVILTAFLYQKGSSESKDPDSDEAVDRKPLNNKEDVPWPVRKGGWILKICKHSLSIALFLIFILSFLLHWYGSLKDYNQQQLFKRKMTATAMEYLSNSKLWFESFQNWQSEFLSVFAMMVLTIYLRQKGSAQSKPVDAPHDETGE